MFEVIYQYYERAENGSWNRENVKEIKKRIGKENEDIPLEKLANIIMSQLARRDILVLDVIIHEFKKVPVTFREAPKGGIILKNKRFTFDNDTNNLTSEDVPEVSLPQPGTTISPLLPQPGTIARQPHEMIAEQNVQRRPIKIVMLDTDAPVLFKVKQAGLQFSPNKKYPVFEEKSDPRDKRVDKFGQPALDRKMVYVMWDDQKREVSVSADYFVPGQVRLEGGIEFNRDQISDEPKLSYDGEVKDNIPYIRRS